MSVPLLYRLPNPPAVFVGRRDEKVALARCLRRAPVSVVFGPGGIGKSALAVEVLHRKFATRVPSTHHVVVASRGDLVAELSRAFQLRSDESETTERRLEAVIDTADRRDAWILIDDLHRTEAGVETQVLSLVARYARRARWLFTSRTRPTLEALAGQNVSVRRLSDDDLLELAKQISSAASPEEHTVAVARSSGSPWLLHRQLGFGDAERIFEGLTPETQRSLASLARLERPLPAALLQQACRLTDLAFARLGRFAIVERAPGGVRLHDLAKAALEPTEVPASFVEALAESELPRAHIEAIRLYLDDGVPQAARAVLDRRGRALLEGGWGPELWLLLAHERSRELGAWRLECALEAAPGELSRLRAPLAATPRETLIWARVLMRRGDMEDALVAASKTASRAIEDGDEEVAHEATRIRARVLFMLGRADEAIEVLRVHPSRSEQRFRHEALEAACRISTADTDAAHALVARLLEEANALPLNHEEEEAVRRIAWAAYELGNVRGAIALLDRLMETGRVHAGRDVGRQTLVVASHVYLDHGRLDTARVFFERTAALADTPLGRSVLVGELRMALAGGLSDGLIAKTRAIGHALDFDAWRQLLEVEIHTALGLPAAAVIEASGRPTVQALLATAAWENRIRHGAVEDPPAQKGWPALPEVCASFKTVAAQGALLRGEQECAQAYVEEAIRTADHAGYGIVLGKALATKVDIELCASRVSEARRTATDLGEHATWMPSARFAEEAAFLTWCTDDAAPIGLLARWLVEPVAPVVERRARALLGFHTHLDRLDERVVQALRARRPALASLAGLSREVGTRAEVIIIDAAQVWLPCGPVSLADGSIGAKLVRTLARHGGAASKEELVVEVWDVAEYHPLRHDNRLKQAIKKLRQTVEVDPATPRRLLTSDGGYAFGPGALLLSDPNCSK
ncbi:MAG: NB-ARC domain-containing protein [Myxococcota bacterium]